jgi:hypothetical protein
MVSATFWTMEVSAMNYLIISRRELHAIRVPGLLFTSVYQEWEARERNRIDGVLNQNVALIGEEDLNTLMREIVELREWKENNAE